MLRLFTSFSLVAGERSLVSDRSLTGQSLLILDQYNQQIL